MQKKNDWENSLHWNFDEVQVWMLQNEIVVAKQNIIGRPQMQNENVKKK
jgi:hypothetical protein